MSKKVSIESYIKLGDKYRSDLEVLTGIQNNLYNNDNYSQEMYSIALETVSGYPLTVSMENIFSKIWETIKKIIAWIVNIVKTAFKKIFDFIARLFKFKNKEKINSKQSADKIKLLTEGELSETQKKEIIPLLEYKPSNNGDNNNTASKNTKDSESSIDDIDTDIDVNERNLPAKKSSREYVTCGLPWFVYLVYTKVVNAKDDQHVIFDPPLLVNGIPFDGMSKEFIKDLKNNSIKYNIFFTFHSVTEKHAEMNDYVWGIVLNALNVADKIDEAVAGVHKVYVDSVTKFIDFDQLDPDTESGVLFSKLRDIKKDAMLELEKLFNNIGLEFKYDGNSYNNPRIETYKENIKEFSWSVNKFKETERKLDYNIGTSTNYPDVFKKYESLRKDINDGSLVKKMQKMVNDNSKSLNEGDQKVLTHLMKEAAVYMQYMMKFILSLISKRTLVETHILANKKLTHGLVSSAST